MPKITDTFVKTWVVLSIIVLAIALPWAVGDNSERLWPVFGIVLGVCLLLALVTAIVLKYVRWRPGTDITKLGVSTEEYHDIVYLARRNKLPAGYDPQIVLAILERDQKTSLISLPMLLVIVVASVGFSIASIVRYSDFPYGLTIALVPQALTMLNFKFRVIPIYERLRVILRQRINDTVS